MLNQGRITLHCLSRTSAGPEPSTPRNAGWSRLKRTLEDCSTASRVVASSCSIPAFTDPVVTPRRTSTSRTSSRSSRSSSLGV